MVEHLELQQPRAHVEPTAPDEASRRRWAWWLLALGAVGAGLATNPGNTVAVAVVFVLVVPFEKMFPRHRHQRIRRAGLGTDLAYALSSPVMGAIGLAAGMVLAAVSLAWLPGLLMRPLVGALPSAVVPVGGFVLFDMVLYWAHRWSHEVPALWRFHAVHHSSRSLDWVSGFRVHPIDGLMVAPPVGFLLAAGFRFEVVGLIAVVQGLVGVFLHANVRWRLRPLHKVVITPEFHHWHHADVPAAHHTNYSAFLPVWDLLFGTYRMPRDERPEVYGISEAMPRGFGAQLLHPFRGFPTPWSLMRHPVQSARRGRRAVIRLLAAVWRSTRRSEPTAQCGG